MLHRVARFMPQSANYVENCDLYNPKDVRLDKKGRESLEHLLEYWRLRIEPLDAKLMRIEDAAIERGAVQSVAASSAEFFQSEDFFLVKRTERDAGDGDVNTYHFKYGQLPDRDFLLMELSRQLAQAESDLIIFFRARG